MKTTFLNVCALILFFFEAALGQENSSSPNSIIEGTWRWMFTMPDGTVANPRLNLAVEDGKLVGTTSFRVGVETPITNAVLHGDRIRFQILSERDGQHIVTTYSGKWDGNVIRGSIESNWTGEPRTYAWEADRAYGIEGLWKWRTPFGERKIEVRALLHQEGGKLEGTVGGRGRGGRVAQPARIKNGSIKENGEIYFEVKSGSQRNGLVTQYSGKLTGDTIQGSIDSNVGGVPRKVDWTAQRGN